MAHDGTSHEPLAFPPETPAAKKARLKSEAAARRKKRKRDKANRARAKAKKEAEAAKAKEKAEKKAALEWDDQSFLWDHIASFENVTKKSKEAAETAFMNVLDTLKGQPIWGMTGEQIAEAGGALNFAYHNAIKPYLYKNFLQIKDDEPTTTKNKLFAMGINSLNKASNAQLSSIVPYFKLFKVLPQEPNVGGQRNRTRIEFPFNKFTTMESILESRENRGTDVGMKSVKWEDTGANPGNVGLAFKGSFLLHFQSFEGIFKTRIVDGHEIRFADIMVLESLTGKSAQKNPLGKKGEQANDSNVNCKTVTEIHMECGWTLPPDGIVGDPRLGEELEKLRRTYIITPIDQDIKVTNNGAVDMEVSFCAAIEGRAFGAVSDLLNIDETLIVGKGATATIAELEADIKSYRERMKALRQGKPPKKTGPKTKASANAEEKVKNERKKLREEFTSAKSNLRALRYKRLLTILRTGLENRVFYVDLDPELIEIYKKILKAGAESYTQSKEEDRQGKADIKKEFQATRRKFASEIGFVIGKQAQEHASSILAADSDISKGIVASMIPPDGWKRLHYIFLGDIVEAAMTILYDQPDPDNTSKGPPSEVCPELRTDVRVLMGSFSYLDPGSGNIRSMAMADIPVSFSYFNSWWHDNVVKKNLDKYPLRVFLRDLCGTLLNNVMAPKRYGGMPGKRLRCSVQSVFTKKSHPLDNEWVKKAKGPKKRIDIAKVFKELGTGRANQYSQWLYVYVDGGQGENSKLRGKIDEDLKRNIPHYFVGGSTGVIKDISFTKTKIPGKRESLIFRSRNDGNTQDNLLFSDRYDAKVRLLGNPIFKPGMIIYIDPRSMGLGLSEDVRTSPAAYMSDLGIGGYYRVVRVNNTLDPTKFETELSTVSELSVREIFKNKKAKKG